jgi:hypothetical protein
MYIFFRKWPENSQKVAKKSQKVAKKSQKVAKNYKNLGICRDYAKLSICIFWFPQETGVLKMGLFAFFRKKTPKMGMSAEELEILDYKKDIRRQLLDKQKELSLLRLDKEVELEKLKLDREKLALEMEIQEMRGETDSPTPEGVFFENLISRMLSHQSMGIGGYPQPIIIGGESTPYNCMQPSISDEEIRQTLNTLPKKIIRQLKKLDFDDIKKVIKEKYPQLPDKMVIRAIEIIKE